MELLVAQVSGWGWLGEANDGRYVSGCFPAEKLGPWEEEQIPCERRTKLHSGTHGQRR